MQPTLPGPVQPCNCSSADLCRPLALAPRTEVFAFHGGSAGDVWRQFDYSVVTTVCVTGQLDPELVCFAHAKNVRVTLLTTFANTSLLPDPAERQQWAKEQLQMVQEAGADGINMDIEGPQQYRDDLTLLVQETTTLFRSAFPRYQLSFDTDIHPASDTANYNFTALADALDFVVPMAYDMSWNQTVAAPNSPFPGIMAGIYEYLELGVPADKIVLALPWYGFMYPCPPGTPIGAIICRVSEPFGGGGWTLAYRSIIALLDNATSSGFMWDTVSKSPFFNFVNRTGGVWQLWFDNPDSLTLRYDFARTSRLRGISMWTADFLDYSGNYQDMWRAVHSLFC